MCEWLANRQTVDFKRNLKPMMVQVQQPIILLAIYSLSFSILLVGRWGSKYNGTMLWGSPVGEIVYRILSLPHMLIKRRKADVVAVCMLWWEDWRPRRRPWGTGGKTWVRQDLALLSPSLSWYFALNRTQTQGHGTPHEATVFTKGGCD